MITFKEFDSQDFCDELTILFRSECQGGVMNDYEDDKYIKIEFYGHVDIQVIYENEKTYLMYYQNEEDKFEIKNDENFMKNLEDCYLKNIELFKNKKETR